MQRVLVLGCSGAGKTTLARELAAITGLPLVHLDQHYWRPGWTEPDAETWTAQLSTLVAQPRWVMDGNYGGTLALRLSAADTAIFLDLPRRVCVGRILRRYLIKRGRTRSDMGPECPERLHWGFLAYVWRFQNEHRPRVLEALRHFGGHLITLRSSAAVRAYLSELRRSGCRDR